MRHRLASLGFAVFICAAASARAQGTVEPIGTLEGDYRRHSHEFEGRDGFVIRRARAGLRFRPSERFDLRLVAELARATPGILDAFGAVRLVEGLELNVGYFRNPNMLTGRDERAWMTPVPERAMITAALWPNRDLGFEVHWFPRRWPVEVWARAGNGVSNPLGPEDSTPTAVLRVDGAFGRLHAWGSRGQRLGLRVGAAVMRGDAPERPGPAGVTEMGFQFFRPVTIVGARLTVTGHLRAVAGPVQLTVEGGWERDARARDTDDNPLTPRDPVGAIDTYGAMGELSWMLTGHHRVSGEWPWSPRQDRPYGAIELAARFERSWFAQGADDVPGGGVAAAAGALRWWPNRWSGLALAVYLHRFDRAPLEAPAQTSGWNAVLRAVVRVP